MLNIRYLVALHVNSLSIFTSSRSESLSFIALLVDLA